jgi:hypothetical protein
MRDCIASYCQGLCPRFLLDEKAIARQGWLCFLSQYKELRVELLHVKLILLSTNVKLLVFLSVWQGTKFGEARSYNYSSKGLWFKTHCRYSTIIWMKSIASVRLWGQNLDSDVWSIWVFPFQAKNDLGMVTNACNPSTQKVRARGQSVWGCLKSPSQKQVNKK